MEAVRCGKIGACEKFHKRISDKSGLRIRRRENAKRHAACNAKKRKICAVQPTKLCPGNPFAPRPALSHEFDQFNPFSCRHRRYALNCSFFGSFRLSGSSERKVSNAPPEEISEAPGAIAGISGVATVVSTIRISIRCKRPPNLKTANSSKNNSPTQEPKRITTVDDAPSGMPPTCKTPTPLKSPKSPKKSPALPVPTPLLPNHGQRIIQREQHHKPRQPRTSPPPEQKPPHSPAQPTINQPQPQHHHPQRHQQQPPQHLPPHHTVPQNRLRDPHTQLRHPVLAIHHTSLQPLYPRLPSRKIHTTPTSAYLIACKARPPSLPEPPSKKPSLWNSNAPTARST